jgi:trans-2,3-dihydro-3-hydroxyanthranilate isomerase
VLRYLFYIVDVFAEEKYQGNQLAVVRNAEGLSEACMQQIAREINFSETAFILSDERRNNGYEVRIFTPETEVPFAGHPSLGAAFVIQNLINHDPHGKVLLHLKAGPVWVDFDQDNGDHKTLWMTPITPTFGDTLSRRPVAKVLGLNPEDIDDRFPVQFMSTGIPFIMVPLKNLEATQRARENSTAYARIAPDCTGPIFLFCPQTMESGNHLHARMFAGRYGIAEDPATGSANACLAAYLAQHRYFGKPIVDVRVEQGYAVNRRSLLYLRANDNGRFISVEVGGKVFLTAKGELV